VFYFQRFPALGNVESMCNTTVYECFLQAKSNSFVWDYSLILSMLEISRQTHKAPVVQKQQHNIDNYQEARKKFTSAEEMVLANEFHNESSKRTLLAPNRFEITASDCDHFVWWDRDGNEKSSDDRLSCASENIFAQFPFGHRFLIFRNPKVTRSVPNLYHLHVFVKKIMDAKESKIDFIYEFEDESFEEECHEIYVKWTSDYRYSFLFSDYSR